MNHLKLSRGFVSELEGEEKNWSASVSLFTNLVMQPVYTRIKLSPTRCTEIQDELKGFFQGCQSFGVFIKIYTQIMKN